MTSPPTPYHTRPTYRATAYGIIAFGVIVRLVHLLSETSLYIDEARLALNVGARDFGGLTRPLDLEQLASVPFLWAVKATTELAGMSELALRLVPFLAGIALLPVLWALFRRLGDARLTLLALLLAAFAPALVRCSNQLKPYSLDCLAAAVTLLAALMFLRREPLARSGWLFASAAISSAMVSLPAPFFVAPAGAIVAYQAWRSGERRAFAVMVGGAVVAGGIWLAGYWLTYSNVANSTYMQTYWHGMLLRPDMPEFLPRLTFVLSDLTWGTLTGGFPLGTSDGVSKAVRWLVVAGALPIALAGSWLLRRTLGTHHWLLMMGPSGCLVMAALGGFCPAASRLWLFVLPIWLLLIAVCCTWVMDRVRLGAPGRLAVVVAVAGPSLIVTVIPTLWPYLREESRDLVRLANVAPSGDAIYVFANAGPAWLYYSTNWQKPDAERQRWYLEQMSYGGAAFENASRYSPVEQEGLAWKGPEHLELLGAPTGQYWLPYFGLARETVPNAWVNDEATRILKSGASRAWLLFTHYRGSENRLLDLLVREGARELSAQRRAGALLISFELPAQAQSSAVADTAGTAPQ